MRGQVDPSLLLRGGQQLYLEDEGRAGLQLQQTAAAQRLEHGVRVVAEGLVDHQHGAHVVHDEPDLVGAAPALREALIGARHRGRQTHHHGVVDDGAILHERRGNIKEGGEGRGRGTEGQYLRIVRMEQRFQLSSFLSAKRCKNVIINPKAYDG